jgi:hypothetical protein
MAGLLEFIQSRKLTQLEPEAWLDFENSQQETEKLTKEDTENTKNY